MKARLFYPACMGLLMLMLAAVGVMNMLGYRLIEAAAAYILFGLFITMALGGFAIWIVRKIRKNGPRILVGILSAMLVSAMVLGMFVFFSFVGSFYTPQFHEKLQTENGRELVVLKQLSQHYAYDRAKDSPDSALRYEDLGYRYQIYPVFSKFFYNSKSPAEGSLEIGCTSSAGLNYAWEGNVLRVTIENPEEYDVGELIFH